MKLPEQRIRIVAAEPIEIETGGGRLLPSVLVKTLSKRWSRRGLFRLVQIRPVSVVVEDADGARWHEIPNATADRLNGIAVAAVAIALAGIAIVAIINLVRRI